jgi:hypothetical protein
MNSRAAAVDAAGGWRRLRSRSLSRALRRLPRLSPSLVPWRRRLRARCRSWPSLSLSVSVESSSSSRRLRRLRREPWLEPSPLRALRRRRPSTDSSSRRRRSTEPSRPRSLLRRLGRVSAGAAGASAGGWRWSAGGTAAASSRGACAGGSRARAGIHALSPRLEASDADSGGSEEAPSPPSKSCRRMEAKRAPAEAS